MKCKIDGCENEAEKGSFHDGMCLGCSDFMNFIVTKNDSQACKNYKKAVERHNKSISSCQLFLNRRK